MESINEIGVNTTTNIYTSNVDGKAAVPEKSLQNEDAAYNEIAKSILTVSEEELPAVKAEQKKEVDKSKMLELLGPSVTEKYSELIMSISDKTNQSQNFIEKVNSKVDLYA